MDVGQRVVVSDAALPHYGLTGTVVRKQRGRNLGLRFDDTPAARALMAPRNVGAPPGRELELGIGARSLSISTLTAEQLGEDVERREASEPVA